MPSVTLQNVTKRFQKSAVVEDFSLEVREGELMVLAGPSGCGNSTTLRMIAGLEETSSGAIRIGTRDVTGLEPRDRNVAMVFQNYALYPHKTVFENLAFGLRMRGLRGREVKRRVGDAAEKLGLTDMLFRRPRQLSGGQMQRVALGRALVREPDAFLLDEPLSNLDAKLRVQLREEIARLSAGMRSSMIYVTHDQIEAMTLGHRICVMNGGRVQQTGTPLDVYHRPANKFVAGFIGTPEMNFIEGEITENASLRAGPFLVRLDPSNHKVPPLGAKVTLGIRAEHVDLTPPDGPAAATVVLVEHLGAQTIVIAERDGVRFAALTEAGTSLKRAQTVGVALTEARTHLFDTLSGRSLARSFEQE
jgi:multiple sugar transport system ATP-binding protein